MRNPQWWLAWSPVVTRVIGYLGIMFVAGVWMVSNRLEPLLIGLFGSMIAGGEGLDAWKDFRLTQARAPERTEDGEPKP